MGTMPQMWKIVGGAEKGGLLVRDGRGSTARELPERLATDSLVEEIELKGERLRYRRVTGTGPEIGWISVAFKGKTLAERTEGSPPPTDPPPTKPEAATPKPQAANSKSASAALAIRLTREQAWNLQEELIAAYSDDAFQQRLSDEWKKAGDDPVLKVKARGEVCLDVQGPIISRYGFEASRKGVALSVSAYHSPELKNDQEIQDRNAHLGWLVDLDARQGNPLFSAYKDVSKIPPKPEPEPEKPKPKLEERRATSAAAAVRLTREQANSMADELIAGYKSIEFQTKLHSVWALAGDSTAKKMKARQEVCLEIQGPIVAKYGFDASFDGVMYALQAWGLPEIANDEEVQSKTQYMLFLVNPDLQAAQAKKGIIGVWKPEPLEHIGDFTVILYYTVKQFKVQLESETGMPWQAQKLMTSDGIEMLDTWPLEFFVPGDGRVDLGLHRRRPEIEEWLMRITDGPEAWDRCRKCLEAIPQELLADEEFVVAACQYCKWTMRYAASALNRVRHVVLAAVKHAGKALEFASEDLRADREVVMTAVAGDRADPWALQFAAPELRADREVVLAAVSKDGDAVQFAAEDLKADREVAILAAKRDGWVLTHLSDELQVDREVVLTAVRQNWEVLETVNARFHSDREVVLAAVRQDGWALEFAAPNCQADREVVLAAVQTVGEALRFTTKELRADREVAFTAVSHDGLAISMVPKESLDFDICLAAVRQDPRALLHVDSRYRARVLDAMGWTEDAWRNLRGDNRGGSQPGAQKGPGGMTATLKKHFHALGLDEKATISQIRKSYRSLALEHHPDKHPENPQKAKETFQKINTAYQAIKDYLKF